MQARETIAILDFGSQYSQLIARRVRENHVYSELLPSDVAIDRLRALPLRCCAGGRQRGILHWPIMKPVLGALTRSE